MRLFIFLFLFSLLSCSNESSNVSGLVYSGSNSGEETNYILISNSAITMPVNGTYGNGSTLIFQVHYEKEVTVSGTPQLKLNIANKFVYADLVTTEPSNVLEFHYQLNVNDHDQDGIVLYNSLVMNGADILDVDGNEVIAKINDSNILLYNVLVDTLVVPPAKITSINTAPSSESGVLNMTWNAPASDQSILNYSVQYRKKGVSSWTDISPNPVYNNVKLTGLEYNTDYEVRVSANNGVLGNYSDIQDVFIFDLMTLDPIAWLDATDPNGDGSLPSDGSLISRWVDKTGMATDATESDDNRKPFIEYNAINGLPSIRFDQLAQGLEGGFVRTNNGGLTVFLVGKMDTNNSRDCFFEFYQEGSPTSGASSRRGFFFNYGFNEASDNFQLDDTGFNVWTAYDNGYQTSMWENGLNVFTDNPNHFGATEFMGNGVYILGDDMTGGDAIGGYISEFLIFDRELTAEETQLIEEYLSNKWGI